LRKSAAGVEQGGSSNQNLLHFTSPSQLLNRHPRSLL
jgi:hypothetical protein